MELSENDQLTQEKVDHVTFMQKLSEQSSFEIEERKSPFLPSHTEANSAVEEPTIALTQEELDHIAYVQKLAEESSCGISALQNLSTSNLNIQKLAKDSSIEKAGQQKFAEVALVEQLTKEELDHIANIQLLAEACVPQLKTQPNPSQGNVETYIPPAARTSVEKAEIAQHVLCDKERTDSTFGVEPSPRGDTSQHDISSTIRLSEENPSYLQSLEETTSDQLAQHLRSMQPCKEGITTLEEPSMPYLEEVKGSQTRVEENSQLTQEELDHIAYVQRLAEESLYSSSAPLGKDHNAAILWAPKASEAHKIAQEQLSDQSISESTSGADQLSASDLSSPAESEDNIGHFAFEQLGHRMDAEPTPTTTVTQKQLHHIAYKQTLTEEFSVGKPTYENRFTPHDTVSHSEADSGSEGDSEYVVQKERDQADAQPLEKGSAFESLLEKNPAKTESIILSWASEEFMNEPVKQEPLNLIKNQDNLESTLGADQVTSNLRSFEEGALSDVQPFSIVQDYSNIKPTAQGKGTLEDYYFAQDERGHTTSAAQGNKEQSKTFYTIEDAQYMQTEDSYRDLTSSVSHERDQLVVQERKEHNNAAADTCITAESEDDGNAEEKTALSQRAFSSPKAENFSALRSSSLTSSANRTTKMSNFEPFSRSTSINYTFNMGRVRSVSSSRHTSTTLAGIDDTANSEEDYRSGTTNDTHSRGGSSVHVIYTDHSLRASQSSHQGEVSEPEDDGLFGDPFGNSADQDEKKILPQIGVIVADTDDEKTLRRSMSDVVQDESESLIREHLRCSLSSSCVSNVCSQNHAHLNAYELCERHSFTDSRDLLCNVDFLCRLNFAAHRLTEDIADEAGRELRIHYRAQSNPRARYFADTALPRFSASSSSVDDDQSSG
ncbi:unnamed protein product [Strongylus vulgaris]|uniref:Uncharacterized protein n=1 Tax=Strongylus vulgaris TaxID=40348 RepID=A0A3P7K4A7_STRVU|nr:unnamed protein product [Strongylus vulgaris]